MIIYWKDGTTNNVPDGDVSYWLSTGWSKTDPTAGSGGTTGGDTGGTTGGSGETKKATLYGPNGQKEVVDVGSSRASELQSQGWGLTAGSYKEPSGGSSGSGEQYWGGTDSAGRAVSFYGTKQEAIAHLGQSGLTSNNLQGFGSQGEAKSYSSEQLNNSSSKKATLYGPNGQTEIVDVGSSRASELQSQGWGLTSGSYKDPNSGTSKIEPFSWSRAMEIAKNDPALMKILEQDKAYYQGKAGSASNYYQGNKNYQLQYVLDEIRNQGDLGVGSYGYYVKTLGGPTGDTGDTGKATLYGPDGQSEVVDVGSARASELQSQGWGLTEGSYTGTGGTEDTGGTGQYANSDKKIYKDPNSNDLYYKIGDKFYKINTQEQLEKLVIEQGFDDTREELPSDFQSGVIETDEDYQQRLDSAYGIIDQAVADGILPKTLGDLYKTVVGNMPRGVEFESQEVLDEFKRIRDSEVDPYYKELADVAMKDYSETYGRLEQSRNREAEQERIMYDAGVKSGRDELESSGLTFSGKGVEELGAKSAYARDEDTVIPNQDMDPFAGEYLEGNIPKQARLMASTSSQRYEEAKQSLGRSAENYFGGEYQQQLNSLGIPYQSAGVNKTGQLGEAKQQELGSRLQSIINQYRQKQSGLEDISFNF